MNTENKITPTRKDAQEFWRRNLNPMERGEVMIASNSSQFKTSRAMLNCCFDYLIENRSDELMTLKEELQEQELSFVATLSPKQVIRYHFPKVTDYELSTHETRFELGQTNRPLRVFLSGYYLAEEKWGELNKEQRSYILDIIA